MKDGNSSCCDDFGGYHDEVLSGGVTIPLRGWMRVSRISRLHLHRFAGTHRSHQPRASRGGYRSFPEEQPRLPIGQSGRHRVAHGHRRRADRHVRLQRRRVLRTSRLEVHGRAELGRMQRPSSTRIRVYPTRPPLPISTASQTSTSFRSVTPPTSPEDSTFRSEAARPSTSLCRALHRPRTTGQSMSSTTTAGFADCRRASNSR